MSAPQFVPSEILQTKFKEVDRIKDGENTLVLGRNGRRWAIIQYSDNDLERLTNFKDTVIAAEQYQWACDMAYFKSEGDVFIAVGCQDSDAWSSEKFAKDAFSNCGARIST